MMNVSREKIFLAKFGFPSLGVWLHLSMFAMMNIYLMAAFVVSFESVQMKSSVREEQFCQYLYFETLLSIFVGE